MYVVVSSAIKPWGVCRWLFCESLSDLRKLRKILSFLNSYIYTEGDYLMCVCINQLNNGTLMA